MLGSATIASGHMFRKKCFREKELCLFLFSGTKTETKKEDLQNQEKLHLAYCKTELSFNESLSLTHPVCIIEHTVPVQKEIIIEAICTNLEFD